MWARSKSSGHSVLYLYLIPGGLSVLVSGKVNIYQYLSAETEAELFAALKVLVKEHDLEKCKTHLAISRQDYQLLYIDSPKVPDDEIAQAAKFSVKDLLDFPIADATVDAFQMPPVGSQQKANVVATKTERILYIRKMLNELQLTVVEITIPEIALGTTVSKLCHEHQVLAIIFKGVQFAHIMVVKENEIQMIRDIGPAKNLDDGTQLESITLEIQRSLDFYQTALRGTPPAKIYLSYEINPTFQTQLKSAVSQQVAPLPKPDTQDDITHGAVVYSLKESAA